MTLVCVEVFEECVCCCGCACENDFAAVIAGDDHFSVKLNLAPGRLLKLPEAFLFGNSGVRNRTQNIIKKCSKKSIHNSEHVNTKKRWFLEFCNFFLFLRQAITLRLLQWKCPEFVTVFERCVCQKISVFKRTNWSCDKTWVSWPQVRKDNFVMNYLQRTCGMVLLWTPRCQFSPFMPRAWRRKPSQNSLL